MTVLATHLRGELARRAANPQRTPSRETSRPPLVLLHAFPMDHEMWDQVALRLDDLPLILVDLPGFGLSPTVDPTMSAAAEALWATMDAAGHDRVVLGGLSMGGYVAMAALRLAPHRIAGLVLADTKARADDAETRQHRLAVARDVESTGTITAVLPMAEALLGATTRAERPHLAREVRGWIARCEVGAIVWAQTAMASRPSSAQTLAEANALPAAVIVGEQDAQSPVAVAEELAELLVGASFTVIPGVGHLSAVEAPDAVAEAIRTLYVRAAD